MFAAAPRSSHHRGRKIAFPVVDPEPFTLACTKQLLQYLKEKFAQEDDTIVFIYFMSPSKIESTQNEGNTWSDLRKYKVECDYLGLQARFSHI